jgi:hypothetical protein
MSNLSLINDPGLSAWDGPGLMWIPEPTGHALETVYVAQDTRKLPKRPRKGKDTHRVS